MIITCCSSWLGRNVSDTSMSYVYYYIDISPSLYLWYIHSEWFFKQNMSINTLNVWSLQVCLFSYSSPKYFLIYWYIFSYECQLIQSTWRDRQWWWTIYISFLKWTCRIISWRSLATVQGLVKFVSRIHSVKIKCILLKYLKHVILLNLKFHQDL